MSYSLDFLPQLLLYPAVSYSLDFLPQLLLYPAVSSSENSDTSSDSADDDEKEERTPRGKRARAGQNNDVEVSILIQSYDDNTITLIVSGVINIIGDHSQLCSWTQN